MRVLLFPGQGSQKVGMGKDLVEEYKIADETYKEADETLGFSISNISFEGPEEELTKTRNAQLSILVYSFIAEKILRMKKNIDFDFTAGHSLGEFSAILCAGMLTFKDALLTVKKRGELMTAADPDGRGGMAAVLGLDDSIVKKICLEISREKYVEVVNYNSPGQVVISGLKEGIELAEKPLKDAGARRVLKLNVSGAFHSNLMENSSVEFGKFLKSIEFKKPRCRVVANVTADFLDERNVRDMLTLQMKSPVLWSDSIRFLKKNGVNEAIEVGFGNVISGLVRKIDENITVRSWSQLLI